MSPPKPTRILIVGGGFGGLYAALRFEKALVKRRDIEVTLVNSENYFLFTPMLHEVASGDLDESTIVSPARTLLRRVRFFAGRCEAIDLAGRTATLRHGADAHTHAVPFDHVLLALGSITSFHGVPGVEQRAFAMKTLPDAVALRNRIIANLEEADSECCAVDRRSLLTFVVAGGGFAGVETAASINDFIRKSLGRYPNLSPDQVRVIVAHSGSILLPELNTRLGLYAQHKLASRGVEIRLGTRVAGMDDAAVRLSDGSELPCNTLVWTAGTAPHPLLESLPMARERGRVVVDECLRAVGTPGAWALGDCAVVPDIHSGKPCPPTAQHALRQGRLAAGNILAAIEGRAPRRFVYRAPGQLASLGHRSGVASIFGMHFSGFVAWWLWRTIYLSKLPRFQKKCRVALSWALDILFSKDLVHLEMHRGRGTGVWAQKSPVEVPPASSQASGRASVAQAA